MNRHLSAFLSRILLDRAEGHRDRVLAAFRAKGAEAVADDAQRAGTVAERLCGLLRHCRDRVPHWRSLLAGQDINTSNARDILAGLPAMSRSDIQADPDRYKAPAVGPVLEDATGGSTGTPMRFRIDRETQVARESSLMWADSLAGWLPGMKIAMLWGSDRDIGNARGKLRLTLRWWIENRRWYNAFDMGPSKMAEYHHAMEAFRPDLLVAYAGAVFEFARFLQRQGLKPAYPQLGIVSSAEVITGDMRAQAALVFGKPVFDRYGNREFGAIAAECPAHDGMHINESDTIVEVDSPDPERIAGPVRITYLRNNAMPFIRYDTGDLGTLAPPAPCSCGRTTRKLKGIVGRRSDMIRSRNHGFIHGEFFTHLLYGVPGVRQFRFVQETMDAYRLLLVVDERYHDESEDSLRRSILEKVGGRSTLVVERVGAIPPLASGKHRFTVSNL